MKMSEKEYIEHFGVRGMKWGVKKRSSDSTDKGQAAPKPMSDADAIRKVQKFVDSGGVGGTASSKASRQMNKEIKTIKRLESGKLSGKQQVGVAAAAYASYSVGTMVAMKAMGTPSIGKLGVAVAAGTIAGVKGGQAAANIMRKHNAVKLSDIRKAESES